MSTASTNPTAPSLPQQTDAAKRYVAAIHAPQQARYAFDGSAVSSPSNGGDVAAWQARARPALLEVLKLDRIAEAAGGHQPTVTLGPAEQIDGYVRHRGAIRTEPAVEMPFWLLLPPGKGPFPLALALHGHDPHGFDTAVGVAKNSERQHDLIAIGYDIARQAVGKGWAALAAATRGIARDFFIDTVRLLDSNCRSHNLAAMAAGRCAMGERVWDMQRLLDWALKLPQVDGSRVLAFGNSGGGVLTQFLAAADPRITMAIPSCSFTRFFDDDGGIHVCFCNFVPGILQFGEAWDVCGLIAPRPLLVVHGDSDAGRCGDRVERDLARVRRIYQAAGAPDHFAHAYGHGGHRLYPDVMWPWIQRVQASAK